MVACLLSPDGNSQASQPRVNSPNIAPKQEDTRFHEKTYGAQICLMKKKIGHTNKALNKKYVAFAGSV